MGVSSTLRVYSLMGWLSDWFGNTQVEPAPQPTPEPKPEPPPDRYTVTFFAGPAGDVKVAEARCTQSEAVAWRERWLEATTGDGADNPVAVDERCWVNSYSSISFEQTTEFRLSLVTRLRVVKLPGGSIWV